MKFLRKKDEKRVYMLGGIMLLLIIIVYILLQSRNQMMPGNAGNQVPNIIPVTQNPGTASLKLVQQGENKVDVVVDAGVGQVSAVQLYLSYDPEVLTNVQIQKGVYFVHPFELLNIVDKTKGIMTYAIGIAPNGSPQGGKGVVAEITYTTKQGVASQTKIDFLPQTKVTAEGIDTSVLQKPSGISINL
jgi:Cohesin domain